MGSGRFGIDYLRPKKRYYNENNTLLPSNTTFILDFKLCTKNQKKGGYLYGRCFKSGLYEKLGIRGLDKPL